MSLASCRSSMAKVLGIKIPNAHVSEHGGPFTLKELDRVAKKPPAVVVVCMGARAEQQGPTRMLNAMWAAFVVTTDTQDFGPGKRDVQALLLAEAVAEVVMGQNWEQKASGRATQIDINNLYSTDTDKRGAAVWAVRWRQPVDLVSDVATTLDTFETFFATYDIGETDATPVTEQQVELDQ